MANITISNLQPAGLNLFSDSEGYLNDLTETEQNIQGGFWWVGAVMATAGAFGVGVSIGHITAEAYHDYTHISI
jgi:hypothetical protein